MPEPHGFCSLFCCPIWHVAAFLTSHWCVKSFRLLVKSLAEQVVNLILMRDVLGNCLCSAKHSGFCSTSSCVHQGDKVLLCLSGLHSFPLLIQRCFGEQQDMAGLRLRNGKGPSLCGCLSIFISCLQGKRSEVARRLCVMCLGEEEDAECAVQGRLRQSRQLPGHCWEFQHKRCEGGSRLTLHWAARWDCPMDESSKGTIMQENCWGLLTLRIGLHSGNAMAPAAGGKNGTWRICPWADLLLHPSFTSCFQKIGPRTMVSILVQLCHCYMASLWHCSQTG